MVKENIDIAFLILHYITDNDTEICINSIINKCKGQKYKIIVVDNASPNNSYETLLIKFNNNDDIVFIKNIENLGFARGNNIRFQIY